MSDYDVGQPETASDAVPRPRAVFVAHGMGQQVPFETIADVARGLCTAIEAEGGKVAGRTARTVRVGCEVVQRLELTFDNEPPIHVYEGYWAPLTEGVIGLWQVVRFLVSGGLNAIRSGGKLFRFMFGKSREFHIGFRNILALMFTLLFVVSAVIVGTMALAAGATRLILRENRWINPELFEDLTATFELLLAWVLAWSLISVALIVIGRRAPMLRLSVWTHAAPIVLGFIAAAWVAIPLDLVYDTHGLVSTETCDVCPAPLIQLPFPDLSALHDLLEEVRSCPGRETFLWWVLFAVAVVVCIATVIRARSRRPEDRFRGGSIGGVIVAVLALVLVLMLCGDGIHLAHATWIILVAILLLLRRFAIEFVGDVAIYVSPHVVDRFFDVRQRIKTTIWRAARAVYAFRTADQKFLYDRIAVVGHSLGSVAVYDALNRLINEDDLSTGADGKVCNDVPLESLDVARRTKLLLTFGSPLDKTAFVFAMHDAGGGKERDALAASVQPLITRERELKWVNVWSPYDVLGGSLDYYDTPKNDTDRNENRVEGIRDKDAATPFLAHLEFWNHALIYNEILRYLRV